MFFVSYFMLQMLNTTFSCPLSPVNLNLIQFLYGFNSLVLISEALLIRYIVVDIPFHLDIYLRCRVHIEKHWTSSIQLGYLTLF